MSDRKIDLNGKDAALIIREDGLVELNLKMREKTDKVKGDLTNGELFIVALHKLMKDPKWCDIVMNIDYPNCKIGL